MCRRWRERAGLAWAKPRRPWIRSTRVQRAGLRLLGSAEDWRDHRCCLLQCLLSRHEREVSRAAGDFSARVSDYSVPASDKDVVAALTAHKSDSKDCGIVFDGESKGSGPFKVATKDAFVAKVMEAKTNGEAANCLESSIKVTFQNKSLI